MILALAALLTYMDRPVAQLASRAIYAGVFECLTQGIATPDLGGQSSTTGFTDEVISRVCTKLDAWESLG